MRRNSVLRHVVPLGIAAASFSASAATLDHTGLLLGADDQPVTAAVQSMRFRLSGDAAGTSVLWDSGVCSVDVRAGRYAVTLGGPACAAGDIPSPALPGDQPRYLEVQVGNVVLLPRLTISAVPVARDAQRLGGQTLADLDGRFARLSPGAAQTGHLSITGTLSAGQVSATTFVGNGAGLTGVDAAVVGGISPSNLWKKSDAVDAATLGGKTVADFAPAGSYARVDTPAVFSNSVTATSLSGNGAGLTNVNAATVGGIAPSNLWKKSDAVDAATVGGLAASSFVRLSGTSAFTGSVDLSGASLRFPVASGSTAANVPACSAASAGTAYFDTTSKSLRVCDGTAYVSTGGTQSYKSCKEILAGGGSIGDGLYNIDPDGPTGSIAPFQAYCDMAGGGWTLIAKVSPSHGTSADEPNNWFKAGMNTSELSTPSMTYERPLASWGVSRFAAYVTATTKARFTIVAENNFGQTGSWYKYAAPAAFSNWFDGDSTATTVCSNEAMSANCSSGTIARQSGDATNLEGMVMTHLGYSGGVIHMRLNSDGAPVYNGICSSTGDSNGNAWNDSNSGHWGNGLLVWLQ